MKIESTRFGSLEVDDQKVIGFPKGLIGFPEENSFVMVHHREPTQSRGLQSTRTPSLALPVVSVHQFAPAYPDVPLDDAAVRAGPLGLARRHGGAGRLVREPRRAGDGQPGGADHRRCREAGPAFKPFSKARSSPRAKCSSCPPEPRRRRQ